MAGTARRGRLRRAPPLGPRGGCRRGGGGGGRRGAGTRRDGARIGAGTPGRRGRRGGTGGARHLAAAIDVRGSTPRRLMGRRAGPVTAGRDGRGRVLRIVRSPAPRGLSRCGWEALRESENSS